MSAARAIENIIANLDKAAATDSRTEIRLSEEHVNDVARQCAALLSDELFMRGSLPAVLVRAEDAPGVRDAHGTPEVRRFFTGVTNGEVTGMVCTPDQRTMFVNSQHPGEGGGSTWPRPDGITTPRSATVVITKDDGGVIGSGALIRKARRAAAFGARHHPLTPKRRCLQVRR